MRCHCIRPLSVVLVKTDTQENNNDEFIHLTALHRKVSKAEMFDYRKSSLENNALERTAFCSISRFLTRNEDRSLWAFDCSIKNLLHEPTQQLSTAIESFVTPENSLSVKRLKINLKIFTM